ncbi:hypothetical protein YC2023_044656 [Brassica napus]
MVFHNRGGVAMMKILMAKNDSNKPLYSSSRWMGQFAQNMTKISLQARALDEWKGGGGRRKDRSMEERK